jgi:CRP-like cAMP-binding protein
MASEFDILAGGDASGATILRHAAGAARFLRALTRVRQRCGMSNEDALVLMAIGRLGLVCEDARPVVRRPVTGKDVAEEVAMPRETVRRRLGRLADLGLVDLDRQGATIRDLARWLELTAPLVDEE